MSVSSHASGFDHEIDGDIDAVALNADLLVQRQRALEDCLDPGEKKAMKRSIKITQDW